MTGGGQTAPVASGATGPQPPGRTRRGPALPGPADPGWLQTLHWIARPIPFLDRCLARYGPVFTLDLAGWARHVIVARPDLVEAIMRAPPDQLLTGAANELMRPVLGDASVFLLDGAAHREQRRALLRALSQEQVEAAVSAADAAVSQMIAAASAAGPVRIGPLARQTSMAYALALVAGSAAIGRGPDLVRLLDGVLGPPSTVLAFARGLQRHDGPLSPWRWARTRLDRVRATIGDLVRTADSIDGRYPCVAGLLADRARAAGERPDSPAVIDQTLSLLVAGYDTTATAMTWAAAWLLASPDALAGLRGTAADPAGGDYGEAVCLEALRLYPTIEIVSRTPASRFVLDGHTVEAGTLISPCTYLVHRNPQIHPDPERFRPERFLAKRPPAFAFFPFGLGGRSCLGGAFALRQMRAFVTKLFVEHRLQPAAAIPPRPRRRHVTIEPAATVTARAACSPT